MPIDIDPVRPSGISASADEKNKAREVRDAVKRWFTERGVEPIQGFSGNGYHVLVPTIPYTDVKAAAENTHVLLGLLDQKFSNDHAKIDLTVYNPARIWRVYGTKSMKGSSTPDRPHRWAQVKFPDNVTDVDLFELLSQDLDEFRQASKAPKATVVAQQSKRNGVASSGRRRNGWDAETSGKVLAGVLDRAEIEYRTKEKDGDVFFEFNDCPYHTDHDGDHHECCVIVRQDGTYAAKCQHDGDAGWVNSMKAAIGWKDHIGPVMDALGIAPKSPYEATPTGLVWLKPTANGPMPVALTNFTARIRTDVAEDDGVEKRHTFGIEAELRGRTTSFTMAAAQFFTMNWPIENLGASAVVYAGMGTKDHARTAIQVLSDDVVAEHVYTHVGWRKIGEQHVYLHAGGAIGPEGPVDHVHVNLATPLDRYDLPEPPTGQDLVDAVNASLELLNIVPDRIGIPLYGCIWRAPLGGIDFSPFLVGKTSSAKTELAALAQQHWGAAFTARNLPASWTSTANANEALAFCAKDAVMVVDDFAPGGGTGDVQKMHRGADRLLRAVGNNAGRSRMRSDATLRPTKPPRCMMICTGEDVPRGVSLQARLLVLEMAPDMMNWELLTNRQVDAGNGLYAPAMSGFLAWLDVRYDEVRQEMPPRLVVLRQAASECDQHKRTPTIVASLFYGLELFAEFAQEVGVFSGDQAEKFRDRCWMALGAAATAQQTIQSASDPVERFVELLTAAIASGQAHIADVTGGPPVNRAGSGWRQHANAWEPLGRRIGWEDVAGLYLEPEAAYLIAQLMAQGGNEPLAVGSNTLFKRLHEQGMLLSVDSPRQRLKVRKVIEGKNRAVVHVATNFLGGDAIPLPPDSTPLPTSEPLDDLAGLDGAGE